MESSKFDVENKELNLNPKYVDKVLTECYFRKNDLTFDIEKKTFKTGKITLTLEIVLESVSLRDDVLSAIFTTSVDFTTTSDKKRDAIQWENFLNEFYLRCEGFLKDISNVPDRMISPIGTLLNSYEIGISTQNILSELIILGYYM